MGPSFADYSTSGTRERFGWAAAYAESRTGRDFSW